MNYITMGPVNYTVAPKKQKRRSIFIKKIEYITNDIRTLKAEEKRTFLGMVSELEVYNQMELVALLTESVSLKERYHLGMWEKFMQALTTHLYALKAEEIAVSNQTENQVKEALFFYLLVK